MKYTDIKFVKRMEQDGLTAELEQRETYDTKCVLKMVRREIIKRMCNEGRRI